MRRAMYNPTSLIVILAITMGVILGCSPERRYKVLTFLFDGVPAPAGIAGPGQVIVYQHKPYVQGKCGSCHPSDDVQMSITQAVEIAEVKPQVCLRCHEKVRNEFPVMHGPVAATECLFCHTPHESPVQHLLKAPAPRVCVQCHTPEIMIPRPEHKDEKADCLSCHFGHGGQAHGLLRASSNATTKPVMPAAVLTDDVLAAGSRL